MIEHNKESAADLVLPQVSPTRHSSTVKESVLRWLGPLLLVLVVVLVVFLVKNKPEPAQSSASTILQSVVVREIALATQVVRLTAQGVVEPRWQSTLSAQVGGNVLAVSDRLLSGATFKKGDWLLKIDKTDYQLALESAKSKVASATLALTEEQQRSSRALRDWQRSGLVGEPSDLVLRKPQLAAAQATLKAARTQVEKAKTDLKRTVIRAPFSGAVISRAVSLGEVIVPGTPIGVLYATDVMEVTLSLTEQQWQLMDFKHDAPVVLRSTQQSSAQLGRVWAAQIVRQGAVVDNTTRQHSLVVAVKQDASNVVDQSTQPPLIPGLFVTADLPGLELENLLKIPESSITVDKKIWAVDDADQLVSYTIDPVMRREGYTYVRSPLSQPQSSLQLVLKPSRAFLKGVTVTPVFENNTSFEQKNNEQPSDDSEESL